MCPHAMLTISYHGHGKHVMIIKQSSLFLLKALEVLANLLGGNCLSAQPWVDARHSILQAQHGINDISC